MEKSSSQPIAFREIRDVPEILDAAFGIIRLNVATFRADPLRYVAPPLFVATVLFLFEF